VELEPIDTSAGNQYCQEQAAANYNHGPSQPPRPSPESPPRSASGKGAHKTKVDVDLEDKNYGGEGVQSAVS